MDIVNIIIFSTTALMLKSKRVGIYCLSLIFVVILFSSSGPLAYMTGQNFFVRHIVEELIIGLTAIICFGLNPRGLILIGLSLITTGYYSYEYLMWPHYTPTYEYFKEINMVLFELIVAVLWVKSPLRPFKWAEHLKVKLQDLTILKGLSPITYLT